MMALHAMAPASASQRQPRFTLPGERADISVVVVSYNTAHLLERCVAALRVAAGGLAVQLVLVDNASRDGSAAFIRRQFSDVTLIENHTNVGFGRANNQALAQCSGRYVLLLNTDAYVAPDTLAASLQHMQAQPRCGVLGVALVDEELRGGFSGRSFPRPWHAFTLQTGLFGGARRNASEALLSGAHVCDWVVGCYYMVRREVIEQVGLFDPRYFLYFEEVDHCRAVRAAGWQVHCLMDTRVVHVGGGSAESEGALDAGRQLGALQAESSLLYFRKHGGVFGVAQCVALSLLTECVLAAKWVLKRRPRAGLRVFWQRMALMCHLLVATRGGTRPTR